ncbi:hypothetical protein GCM10027598_69190 [Amycolatopsis oliviviridis]|uniref:Uncharacterized protein n=1 Tax=Amycolatopsis oliviviridis TaxID=1471590 RepID=A0ABQ3LZA2_9PSEU|nr:hypothetical protein GCM10017790_61510 [Amycolatopsis oliviviridis]
MDSLSKTQGGIAEALSGLLRCLFCLLKGYDGGAECCGDHFGIAQSTIPFVPSCGAWHWG